MRQKKRSLSPAQLRYFKIGPRILDPQDHQSRRRIDEAIQFKLGTKTYFKPPSMITLNKLSKSSYGDFEGTIRNFNLLRTKQFSLDSVEHQIQKFGETTRQITQKMISNNKNGDRTTSRQKALRQKIKLVSDDRRQLTGRSVKDGLNLKLVLKSFQLKGLYSESSQFLPLSYLKILVQHVNSFNLLPVIQPSLHLQGNQMTIQFQRIVSKISDLNNKQQRYQKNQIIFQRFGKQLKLKVPFLQIISQDYNQKHVTTIDNSDIIKIINVDFQNCDEILDKYFNRKAMRDFE